MKGIEQAEYFATDTAYLFATASSVYDTVANLDCINGLPESGIRAFA